MLKIYFEFRKGIFFIRFIGNMNERNSLEYRLKVKQLLQENKFKYVVINVNYLKTIDGDGISYLNEIYDVTKRGQGYIVLCDEFKLLNKLFNNIPSINSELEVL